jgi:thiamine-phosphate pyrophosphorylase
MSHPQRIIDANANRAREALRVMEDAARFVLDDRDLCARLKSLRHGLAEAIGPIMLEGIAWRDTAGDVGTSVSTASEGQREGMREVVVAAGKRLSEALRSIEECAKTLPAEPRPEATTPMGATIERLRYLGYNIERDLVLAMGSGRTPRWKLCVVLSESLCTHLPWLEVARRAIEGGADCLQLREKAMDSRELLQRARALVELARGRRDSEGAFPGGTGFQPVMGEACDNAGNPDPSPHRLEAGATKASAAKPTVIINDRPDIALLSGADGVHLGQSDLTVRDARRVIGFDLLVGVSTENLEQATGARRDGADYCGVGPMFPTSTKLKPRLAGPAYLREYLDCDPSLPPGLAIGGVTPERMAELRQAGPGFGERWGVAVSSAVCGATDPAAVCRAIIADACG